MFALTNGQIAGWWLILCPRAHYIGCYHFLIPTLYQMLPAQLLKRIFHLWLIVSVAEMLSHLYVTATFVVSSKSYLIASCTNLWQTVLLS